MRLKEFKKQNDYIFNLRFEDGTKRTVDISALVNSKVKVNELKSAKIDNDWGCLEFKDGMIDIDPKTLYNFSILNGVINE